MGMYIKPGDLVTKDPADKMVCWADWDSVSTLPAEAEVVDVDYTIAGVEGDITTTPLVVDSTALLAGNRRSVFRLINGALESKWQVSVRAETNETPIRVIERSFFVRIEER